MHRDVTKRLRHSTDFTNMLKIVIRINRHKFDMVLDIVQTNQKMIGQQQRNRHQNMKKKNKIKMIILFV